MFLYYFTVALFCGVYHGRSPAYMSDAIRVAVIHSRNTRNSSLNFMVPAVNFREKLFDV